MLSLCWAVLLAGTAPLRASTVGVSERGIFPDMPEFGEDTLGFKYSPGKRMRGERRGVVESAEWKYDDGPPLLEEAQIAE